MSPAAIVALGGVAALVIGLVLYERTRGGARELGLVAVLVAAATAGRIAFAAIPSAQPVTAIAIVTGIALGPRAGAAVGAGAALLSNTFLGHSTDNCRPKYSRSRSHRSRRCHRTSASTCCSSTATHTYRQRCLFFAATITHGD